MRIVFSRKGFDTTAGGAPSPIVDGAPLSLPIPAADRSRTSYANRGLAGHVVQATRGKLNGANPCHDDPLFDDGLCWLGQCGSAQGHLNRRGVRAGDHFLFFGLFADPQTGERHHRIFAHMQVLATGSPEAIARSPFWRTPPRPHPHLEGNWPANNTIWLGKGAVARTAAPGLRLTVPGGPLNLWQVPRWLEQRGLSYHEKRERWPRPGLLDSARRGQEFVSGIGRATRPRRWLEETVALIEAGPA